MSEPTPHIDERLLMQFLLGETSAQEMLWVENWLLESAENRQQLDQLEAIWAESGKLTPTPVAVDQTLAWQTLSGRIEAHDKQSKPKTRTLNSAVIRFGLSIAALLILAFGVFKLAIEPNLSVEQLALESQTAVIKGTLPDGSQVALNLNSRITYPEKFSKTERRINLQGEAFFEVSHNPQKPFIIKAGEANIRVWGTSFMVKAHRGTEVQVAVATGKVQLYRIDSLTGDTASIFLKAGEKGILPLAGKEPVKLTEPVSPDELFWMDRTLVFKQISLDKVFRTLEKYYQVSIQVSNPMALECSYTATFNNADITEILNTIATTFGFELSNSQNVYVLKGNGCLNE